MTAETGSEGEKDYPESERPPGGGEDGGLFQSLHAAYEIAERRFSYVTVLRYRDKAGLEVIENLSADAQRLFETIQSGREFEVIPLRKAQPDTPFAEESRRSFRYRDRQYIMSRERFRHDEGVESVGLKDEFEIKIRQMHDHLASRFATLHSEVEEAVRDYDDAEEKAEAAIRRSQKLLRMKP